MKDKNNFHTLSQHISEELPQDFDQKFWKKFDDSFSENTIAHKEESLSDRFNILRRDLLKYLAPAAVVCSLLVFLQLNKLNSSYDPQFYIGLSSEDAQVLEDFELYSLILEENLEDLSPEEMEELLREVEG